MTEKKFITCTLPYANSKPHIGHAFEFIIGDSLSRFFRNKLGSQNVHFNIGLDEHGKKIYDASINANKSTKEFLDELTIEWEQFCTQFEIDYNSFYRTSSEEHYKKVKLLWDECLNKGLLYKKNYTGTYCVGCESFKLEKDLENGHCPDHPTTNLQNIEEENYFLRTTQFKTQIANWAKQTHLLPENKRTELVNVILEAEDISVTRKKESVPWGIPVPNDDTQVIYVWFEALSNYLFSAGYYENENSFEEWWLNSVQIFGPDNLRFQGSLFQSILAGIEVSHTTTLLCHGTILDKNGQKMSKTFGNVIDPIDQLNKYGIDAVRYYALAGLQTYGNSGWSEENLVELYNSDLANNYGNLIARVIHLINIKNIAINPVLSIDMHLFEGELKDVEDCWLNYDINGALNKLREVLSLANKYIQDKEPWKSDSINPETTLNTLYNVLEAITALYEPVIPNKTAEILECLQKKEKAIIFPRIIQNTI
jgi:methionyl-tRNA synthetase